MSEDAYKAGIIIDVVKLNGAAIAVNATATAYTTYFRLPKQASFSVSLRFTSGGVVDALVELEQSNVAPTTDKAADTTNWAVPVDDAGSSVGTIQDITDKVPYVVNFAPVATAYARIKITGQGSNAATTALAVCQLYYVNNKR